MPRGPKGEKRPADVIGTAIMVGRIATGEIDDPKPKDVRKAKTGHAGGVARAKSLTNAERQRIAKAGASSRWKGK